MLAAENYPDVCTASLSSHKLLEIHRSKISLHCAKTGYNYPTIRLPHTFSTLAGLSTSIYQTVHDGALAFLVVVASSHKSEESTGESENVATSSKPSPLHVDNYLV